MEELNKLSDIELQEVLNCLGTCTYTIERDYSHVTNHVFFSKIKNNIKALDRKVNKIIERRFKEEGEQR